MPEHVRTWGFRLSAVDIAAIVAAPLMAWWLTAQIGEIAWALPVALGHFFLFCNVFRVARAGELVWAAIFVIQASAWATVDRLSWPVVVGLQAPVTLVVILLEVRSPRYHGVLARQINPRLDEWLRGTPSDGTL
jgi:hypothetical protein